MYDIYDNDFDRAFDEAVEEIEKQETKGKTIRPIDTGDLISRDTLNELLDWWEHQFAELGNYLETMRDDVRNLPTIEVEPIVRCKDCKKHSDENELHEVFCQVYEAVKPEDGYCDWGERKDEAEDGRCD